MPAEITVEKDNLPKVSVIIPVYNTEKYLRECLDSVVNQTLKDIEIICINDGSTDSSLQILEEYAKKDNRIKIIDKKNEGVGKARNDGIKSAKGEFVCFIDPDDVYPTVDVLEALYNGAKENNVLISGGEFSCFTNEKRGFTQDFSGTFMGYLFPENKIIEYKDYQFDYGYHRFLYGRKFLIQNNIFYPSYKRFQDPPFFANAMIKAKRFYGIHKITYGYRCGHQKVNWNNKKTHDLLRGLSDNFHYAKKYKLDKLSEYTYERLMQHYKAIKTYMDFESCVLLQRMWKYNPRVKDFCARENLIIQERYLKPFLKKNFSSQNIGIHKVITVLGIKLKFKSQKLVERERYKKLEERLNNLVKEVANVKQYILSQNGTKRET